jgi:hypothetical protein
VRPLVTVRDLETGEETGRPPETLTLDLPANLPPGGIFTVADGFRASYTTASGKHLTRTVTPGPLGWRKEGETCLIERSGRGGRTLRRYRAYRIGPTGSAPLHDDPIAEQ